MNEKFDTTQRFTSRLKRLFSKKRFGSSSQYWQDRYATGGNSGPGSYEHLAAFKAEIINGFVEEHNISNVIEFGCGDGHQLSLAHYPSYLGFDISPAAIDMCRKAFSGDVTKVFKPLNNYYREQADLTLSLDVVFHLVEDDIFDEYMRRLFVAATQFVIIYSSDTDDNNISDRVPHVRHRQFSRWITENASDWALYRTVPNRYPYNGDYATTSFSDFFIYRKCEA